MWFVVSWWSSMTLSDEVLQNSSVVMIRPSKVSNRWFTARNSAWCALIEWFCERMWASNSVNFAWFVPRVCGMVAVVSVSSLGRTGDEPGLSIVELSNFLVSESFLVRLIGWYWLVFWNRRPNFSAWYECCVDAAADGDLTEAGAFDQIVDGLWFCKNVRFFCAVGVGT